MPQARIRPDGRHSPQRDETLGSHRASRSSQTRLLLARAATPEQEAFIGRQSGGRVFLFLNTDDFSRDYHAYVDRGVRFVREPKTEPYGTVAVFEDLYGNLWDLVQYNR